jgi:hypothetical protein
MCYASAKGKTKARELLPEEDVWFWDRRVGGEEGDDGVGVGGGDGGEEGGGVEGAGVKEVGGFCELGRSAMMRIDARIGVEIETLVWGNLSTYVGRI